LTSPLHPSNPLRHPEQRSWIEFGSAILNDIAGFCGAIDELTCLAKTKFLTDKFALLKNQVKAALYFDGDDFSLVDAAYGPIFRYFDTFDKIGDFGILAGKSNFGKWRNALSERPSVKGAVSPD
jgi:glutathione S-transferase